MKPQFEGDDRPPPTWKHLAEIGWNVTRLWRGFGPMGPIGPSDGPPALVIPGFLANDRTTLVLRKALAKAGWRVHGWEMGWNRGVRSDTLERLQQRLDAVAPDRPVLLVGWSLGGLYARELARSVPERTLAVVTLGTPFSGDPRQNNIWPLYERIAGHKVDAPPIPRIIDKPPIPHLALWSRHDGIMAPRTARGLDHERDKAVELECAHMAFGVSKRAATRVVREIEIFLADRTVGAGGQH